MTVDAQLEERIAHLVRSGSHEDAAAALVGGYGGEIYGFLISLVGPVDADDAFSDFAERALASIGRFRFESSVRTWAYAVARHCAWHLRRDKARERKRLVDGSRADSAVDKAVFAVRTHTAEAHKTEVKDAIRALREALTKDEQELLTLRVDRGFSWTEIARILDPDVRDDDVSKASAALRKQFERTKQKLKKLAKDRGLSGSRAHE